MRLDGPQKIMKAQHRLHVCEGMSVEDVRKNGSEGQKLAASLFDSHKLKNAEGKFVKDGIYSKREAEIFNNYNFSVKDGIFTMYNHKSGHTTEIKYDNIEDLKNLLNSEFNGPCDIYNKNKENSSIYVKLCRIKEGKTTIDLTNNNIEFNNIKGSQISVRGNNVTVKNSDLKQISSKAKQLNIDNVKDKGIIFDGETRLNIGKDTRLQISNNSEVNIIRDDK